MVAVALGAIAAVGHFIGGMIGWWHAYEITFGGHRAEQPVSAKSGPPAKRPLRSIVVLPLANESEDQEAGWFVDALSTDLTTELARLPDTLVIARETAFTYKGKPTDARSVARDLGVRYVMSGSARREGERVRLNLSMTDGESGAQLWARQVDVERAKLSASFDDIARQVARSLSVEMYRSPGERAADLKPDQVEADDLAMQGWSVYFRGLSKDNLQQALGLFEQAVARDARSIRGWGGVAVMNGIGASIGWVPDREAAVRRLEFATARLQELDSGHLFTYLAKSNLYNNKNDFEGWLLNATEVLARFPSHAPSHGVRAMALTALGRFEECLEPPRRAIQLSPRDSLLGIWHWAIATCHFMRKEYREATEAARLAAQANPNLPMPPLTLAASLARDGRKEQARQIVADYLKKNPRFEAAQVERFMRSSNPRYAEGRTRLIESLRELGTR